jgi:hypothetical protein
MQLWMQIASIHHHEARQQCSDDSTAFQMDNTPLSFPLKRWSVYSWRIDLVDNATVISSLRRSFTLCYPTKPQAPALLLPSDGANALPGDSLTWAQPDFGQRCNKAGSYNLFFSPDSDPSFYSEIAEDMLSFQIPILANPGISTYYWKLQMDNRWLQSAGFSETRSVVVCQSETPAVLVLSSPLFGSFVIPVRAFIRASSESWLRLSEFYRSKFVV